MKRTLAICAVWAALGLFSGDARAQGCAQCRDNLAATSPATQKAYRHAIVMMGGAAGAFFLGTLALFKRQP